MKPRPLRDPRETLTADERSDYEERAAIMEYEGGLERAEAERFALLAVLKARNVSRVQV
jgi:hypothetical protein